MSTFFLTWLDGEATLADFATTPSDGIDRACPLAAIADSFRLQESDGHCGKIVLEF